MNEHTVPPLTADAPCPSGRPYPHTYDARCKAVMPPLMPGGESTSVQLANARDELEQERDRADELARRLAARLGTLLEKDEQLRAVREELSDARRTVTARQHSLEEDLDRARRDLDRAQAAERRESVARLRAERELAQLRAALAEQSTTEKEPTE